MSRFPVNDSPRYGSKVTTARQLAKEIESIAKRLGDSNISCGEKTDLKVNLSDIRHKLEAMSYISHGTVMLETKPNKNSYHGKVILLLSSRITEMCIFSQFQIQLEWNCLTKSWGGGLGIWGGVFKEQIIEGKTTFRLISYSNASVDFNDKSLQIVHLCTPLSVIPGNVLGLIFLGNITSIPLRFQPSKYCSALCTKCPLANKIVQPTFLRGHFSFRARCYVPELLNVAFLTLFDEHNMANYIRNGADINFNHDQLFDGDTLLIRAVKRYDVCLTKLILKCHGLDVNKCNNDGNNALHIAVIQSTSFRVLEKTLLGERRIMFFIIRDIIYHGDLNIDATNQHGRSAIILSTISLMDNRYNAFFNFSVFMLLFSRYPNLKSVDCNGDSILHTLMRGLSFIGSFDDLDGAPIDLVVENSINIYHAIKLVIETAELDLNLQNKYGSTALMEGIKNLQPDVPATYKVISYLLSRNSICTFHRDKYGHSAMRIAVDRTAEPSNTQKNISEQQASKSFKSHTKMTIVFENFLFGTIVRIAECNFTDSFCIVIERNIKNSSVEIASIVKTIWKPFFWGRQGSFNVTVTAKFQCIKATACFTNYDACHKCSSRTNFIKLVSNRKHACGRWRALMRYHQRQFFSDKVDPQNNTDYTNEENQNYSQCQIVKGDGKKTKRLKDVTKQAGRERRNIQPLTIRKCHYLGNHALIDVKTFLCAMGFSRYMLKDEGTIPSDKHECLKTIETRIKDTSKRKHFREVISLYYSPGIATSRADFSVKMFSCCLCASCSYYRSIISGKANYHAQETNLYSYPI